MVMMIIGRPFESARAVHVRSFCTASAACKSESDVNMTDSDRWLSLDDNSPNPNKLVRGNSEKDSLDDVEPHSLETLLPEDENDLLPSLIDELNFTGLPGELDDLDVFFTGGGMELDAESQDVGAANAFSPHKRPNNTSGSFCRASNR